MRRVFPRLSSLCAALALTSLVGATAQAAPRGAAQLSRRVTFTAVPAASVLRVAVGRVVEGKVTFGASLGGAPTGNATEACGRVKVTATKYVPSANSGEFGHNETVKQVSATAVDAGNLSKGCKYSLSGLPHSIGLSIDASYTPTTAWNPVCNGNIAQISTNEVSTVTLPNASVKVTLNQVLDYKYCGSLN